MHGVNALKLVEEVLIQNNGAEAKLHDQTHCESSVLVAQLRQFEDAARQAGTISQLLAESATHLRRSSSGKLSGICGICGSLASSFGFSAAAATDAEEAGEGDGGGGSDTRGACN